MTEQQEYEQYLLETGQHPSQQPAPQLPPEMAGGNLLRTEEGRKSEIARKLIDEAKGTDYGAMFNNALGGVGGGLARAVPQLGRGALGAAAEGALMGAAQAPEGERTKGALMGGGVQGGLSGLAKLLGKAGDVAMQVGVGRKKYTPGVGTELADQGLVGTRGMMRKQAEKRLGAVGQEMGDIASQIPEIDARRIGEEMSSELVAPLTGGGQIAPSARDLGTVGQLQDFATDVSSRGVETGAQAAARRRAAGASAYSARTQDPKLSPIAQASKLEQQKYSAALKAADPRMAPIDASYAALKKAQKSLGEEAPLTGLGLISRPVSTLGGAAATTIAGQAGVKGGKLAEFLSPLARQAAVGGFNQKSPSAEELAEYEQYLRDTGRK